MKASRKHSGRGVRATLLPLLILQLVVGLQLLSLRAAAAAPPPSPSSSPSPSPVIQGPTGGQLLVGQPEGFGVGTLDPEPTALYGPNRVPIVLPDNGNINTLSLPLYYALRTAPDQRLLFELEGDSAQFGMDLSYAIRPAAWRGTLTANLFATRGRNQATEAGSIVVGLLRPRAGQPWFYQVGGGIEYAQAVGPHLQMAAAINYRQTSVHSGAFTPMVPPFDQLGLPLTADPGGTDRILNARVVGLYSTLDSLQFPTRGTKLRFGAEQDIPITSSHIATTHLEANFTRFMPVRLFRFRDGPTTLIFNLQAGTMFGVAPGYDAYSMGGVNSVRGFEQGDFGTGRSFVQATAEYRFPLAGVRLFGKKTDLRGTVFVDFGSDLGTQSAVLGRPGIVRGKPGEGAGIGGGIHMVSPIGLVRLEAGVNNLGKTAIYLTIGDRY